MLDFLSRKKQNKVLDSSVIIDGRIYDIFRSGFLDSEDVIIPLFILEEVQRLADSKDHTKRQKGKRGLETARKIQDLTGAEIWNARIKEVDDIKNIDTKVVILSKHLNAKILTLDHSLNEIAKLHKISVLSIHELYLAVKPRFMIGDEFFVKIKEKGKEQGQGKGDFDGTMVVVDGGETYLGKRVKVEIRTIYSQDTGILIFAKPVKREEDGI